MKRPYHIVVLFLCILGLSNLNCFGYRSYTVQVAASKTPMDVKWFSVKHQIDQKTLEIYENGWYKYVISEFENNKLASDYIVINLQSKGLQDPFPRILSDSLKKSLGKKIKPDIITSLEKKDTIQAKKIASIPLENTVSVQANYKGGKNSDFHKMKPLGKYEVWGKMINGEGLQNIEIKLIETAKFILPKSIIPFYIRVIDKAIRFPIILFFLMSIFLFILITILIIAILEVSNTIKNQIDRYNKLYQTMYERALTSYIFQEFDLETVVLRIKKIHRKRNRKIFVSVLFNLQKNLSGDSDQKILDIFSRLGLNFDAMKKTNSNSYYRQILGLRELTNFFPSGALPFIELHINDKNDELRAEALTSYVRLNDQEPFGFMKNLTKPFTRWTQLTAFYIFKLHKLPAPSFSEYLQSELYNVQRFSLRMITYFQQKENAEEIIKLLNADRELTRQLAIKAISRLEIREANSLLKENFEKESYTNQLEIVKAMKHIGDIVDLEFLEKIIRGNDVTLKIEACRSMYFMNIAGVENIVRLNEEKELNLQAYIAHIDDHRN